MENTDQKKVIGFASPEAIAGETPKGIKWIYRGLIMAAALFTLICASYPNIPQNIQLEVLKITSLGTSVIYYICQQFGWVLPKKDNGNV